MIDIICELYFIFIVWGYEIIWYDILYIVRKVFVIFGWILFIWYVVNKCLEKNGRK